MDGQLQLFQGREQPLQSVGEADGAGGIGQQEGAHDQHDDPQHHGDGGADALKGDVAQQPHVRHRRAAGEEQVHDGGEGHDDIHRLQATGQGPVVDLGGEDAHRQHRRHQRVGQYALGVEQRHDIQDHAQQLGAGVQPVDDGIAGEILAQRDILQHTAQPPFRASSCFCSASTV